MLSAMYNILYLLYVLISVQMCTICTISNTLRHINIYLFIHIYVLYIYYARAACTSLLTGLPHRFQSVLQAWHVNVVAVVDAAASAAV